MKINIENFKFMEDWQTDIGYRQINYFTMENDTKLVAVIKDWDCIEVDLETTPLGYLAICYLEFDNKLNMIKLEWDEEYRNSLNKVYLEEKIEFLTGKIKKSVLNIMKKESVK